MVQQTTPAKAVAKNPLKKGQKTTATTAARRPVRQKPTIIMIHGYRGTHHGLLLIGKLLKNDMNVIIPDIPGFGRGARLQHYDIDHYVEWLHTYIQKQGLRTTPYLMGHSFGSIICAAYAKKYPRTIKKLILVNPIGAPALEGPRRIFTKLAIFYYKIGASLPDGAARKWLSMPLVVRIMSETMAKTRDKQLRTFIHDQHRRYFSKFISPQSALEGFTASVTHDVSQYAKDIKTPSLLIAGTLDDVTPLSAQYALRKKFPNAKLKVIDNVGHLTHYETPDVVAKYIYAFIKSV